MRHNSFALSLHCSECFDMSHVHVVKNFLILHILGAGLRDNQNASEMRCQSAQCYQLKIQDTRDTVDSVNESGEIQQGKKLGEDAMMRSQSADRIHPLVLSFVDLAPGTNHVPCLSARGYVQSL
ncbi:hypothetical protein Q7C36_002721 [Tachysurus vachellii]|uniref:Uncharacterized protein n=1 Tax=Tachysurus vachellii TaxID=175792 RepID=A0AA88NZE1_TACVA|nr:hypothetical protein Q7C36_002721 [Tachysurus vachellii]